MWRTVRRLRPPFSGALGAEDPPSDRCTGGVRTHLGRPRVRRRAPAAQADTGNRDAPHDPATYYAGTEGLSGAALATALNSIIDGNTFIPYTSSSTDVRDALTFARRRTRTTPTDHRRLLRDSLDAANQCGSLVCLDGWNREHTWPQSRGELQHQRRDRAPTCSTCARLGGTPTARGATRTSTTGARPTVPGCPALPARRQLLRAARRLQGRPRARPLLHGRALQRRRRRRRTASTSGCGTRSATAAPDRQAVDARRLVAGRPAGRR